MEKKVLTAMHVALYVSFRVSLLFLLCSFYCGSVRNYSFINSLLTMVVQTVAPLLYDVSPLIS